MQYRGRVRIWNLELPDRIVPESDMQDGDVSPTAHDVHRRQPTDRRVADRHLVLVISFSGTGRNRNHSPIRDRDQECWCGA